MASSPENPSPATALADSVSPPLAGLVNLYKPLGASSARYVYRLRPILGVRKIGHAGTLDPRADGVLIVCVGAATKLVEQLYALPKHYRTTLRLGVTNECFDTERPFEPVLGAVAPSRGQIDDALRKFIGEFDQEPPAFSAARVHGRPSYKLAHRGKPTAVRIKRVRIDRIDVLAYEWPALTLDIHCGRGTYIRALARDLGNALQCGACCETLSRLAVGPFKIEESVNVTAAEQDAVRGALIGIERAREMIA